jgi:hypothetical protein
MKNKDKILFIEILAYIFFTIHYYLLSGISGAICNLIGVISLIVIYIFDKYKLKNKLLMTIILMILLLIINILMFQNIYSIFPFLALTSVILSFLSNNEDTIRKAGAISAICWVIYAIVYKSYISIIFNAITLTNVFLSIYRNRVNK